MTRQTAAALVLLTAMAVAEEQTVRIGPPAARLEVRFLPVSGVPRPGASGFMRVAIRNESSVDQRVRMVVKSAERSWSRIAIERTVRVAGGSETIAFLPLPGDLGPRALQLHVGGTTDSYALPTVYGHEIVTGLALSVAPRNIAERRWIAIKSVLGSSAGSRRYTPGWRAVETSRLPDDWRLLTGFRMIVLGGEDPGLTPKVQAMFIAAMHAGARVIVFRARELADGPLRRLVLRDTESADDGLDSGYHGLGAYLALDFDGVELRRRKSARSRSFLAMRAWLYAPFQGRIIDSRSAARWLPAPWLKPMRIPGVGAVPVRTFFLLILSFAIMVGPVAYLWLRRRKQLTLMVAVVPVAGFTLTAAILLFGLFSEGFGIKGAVGSITLLDQRTHIATTAASRTLYAGLSPASLTLSADTFLSCPVLQGRGSDDRVPHALSQEGHRIDGALLPSRIPTPLTTLTHGRARERLRFRRHGDGFEVLSEDGFTPWPGALLFRDFAGQWWRTARGGLLERLQGSPDEALAALRAPLLKRLPTGAAVSLEDDFPSWLGAVVNAAAVPGSYVARLKSLPSFDDLDLDVNYVAREHLVVGRLAPEDVIE